MRLWAATRCERDPALARRLPRRQGDPVITQTGQKTTTVFEPCSTGRIEPLDNHSRQFEH
jgi:hypothetical protein